MMSSSSLRITGRVASATSPRPIGAKLLVAVDDPRAAAARSSVGPPPVGRMPSTEVDSSSSRTTWPACTSWIDELVLMISRWARAGSASALMSSGMT